MHLCRLRFRPLGAFALTVILVGVYFACVSLAVSDVYAISSPLAHALLICLPVVLSGLVYAVTADDESSRAIRWFRAAVASTLAPVLAFSLIAFVGFIFLDWRM